MSKKAFFINYCRLKENAVTDEYVTLWEGSIKPIWYSDSIGDYIVFSNPIPETATVAKFRVTYTGIDNNNITVTSWMDEYWSYDSSYNQFLKSNNGGALLKFAYSSNSSCLVYLQELTRTKLRIQGQYITSFYNYIKDLTITKVEAIYSEPEWHTLWTGYASTKGTYNYDTVIPDHIKTIQLRFEFQYSGTLKRNDQEKDLDWYDGDCFRCSGNANIVEVTSGSYYTALKFFDRESFEIGGTSTSSYIALSKVLAYY